MNALGRSIDRRAALGAATFIIGGLLLVLGLSGTLRGLFESDSSRSVSALFADTQQLRVGVPVRIDGVSVGKVEAIDAEPDARRTKVTMALDDGAGPLYADARAVLRWRTVLGGTFYIDLERGSAAGGDLGSASIPVRRTARQVELDDISSVIDGRARTGLQTLPRELADALEDPAEPRELFGTLAEVSPDAAVALRALRGRVKDRDLRALVANTATTLRALDAPRDDLRKVVAGGAATLQTVAARSGDVRVTISRSPAIMRETNATLTRLTSTLDRVDPLLAQLRAPAANVGPAVASLRPTVTEANRLVRRATPLLDALRPAAASLRRAAARGVPLLSGLQPSIDRLEKTILPMLSEVDPQTTKSTAVMIGGTFAGLASGAGGQMDANGHFIRFPATAGNSSIYSLPCQSYFANPDKADIATCQSLEELVKTYMSYQPLGKTPGTEPAAALRKTP